jgi:hypothetical protein
MMVKSIWLSHGFIAIFMWEDIVVWHWVEFCIFGQILHIAVSKNASISMSLKGK